MEETKEKTAMKYPHVKKLIDKIGDRDELYQALEIYITENIERPYSKLLDARYAEIKKFDKIKEIINSK